MEDFCGAFADDDVAARISSAIAGGARRHSVAAVLRTSTLLGDKRSRNQ
jgi:hypothetical protein